MSHQIDHRMNRRGFTQSGGVSLGAMALASLLGEQKADASSNENPLAPRPPQFTGRVEQRKSVGTTSAAVHSQGQKHYLPAHDRCPLATGSVRRQADTRTMEREALSARSHRRPGFCVHRQDLNLSGFAVEVCPAR